MFGSRIFTLILGDIAALLLSFFLMLSIRFNTLQEEAYIGAHIKVFGVLFIVWLLIFFIFDLYNIRRVHINPKTIGLLFSAMVANIMVSILFFYLFPTSSIAPKTNLAIIAGSAFIFIILWRRLFFLLFTKQFTKQISLIGTDPLLKELEEELNAHPHLGVINYRADCIPETIPHTHIMITNEDAHKIVLLARSCGAQVLSVANAYETLFGKIHLSLMNEEKALSFLSKERNVGLHFLYRVIEILIASFVLIITSPILILATLAILIEDGFPIFYTQKRVGKNGKLFSVYKLRTMKKDAEKDGARWATQNDPRITTLGKLLRKTHVDEIPQMLNIIKGDIALVGPRPERPEFVAELEKTIPYYFLRHSIRPGFTGWAQIKYRYARSVDDSKEKFEYDLYYIKNKNPLLDIGIVLKTIQIIFTH